MLDPVRSAQYLSELEMIRQPAAPLPQRMIALAKLFDRLVKALTADDKMVFRNFYARFRYLLATLSMREVEQRNLENFRRLINGDTSGNMSEKALEQGILLLKRLLQRAVGEEPDENDGYREGYFTRFFPKRDYTKLTFFFVHI